MLLVADLDGDLDTESFGPLVRPVDVVDLNGQNDSRWPRRPILAGEQIAVRLDESDVESRIGRWHELQIPVVELDADLQIEHCGVEVATGGEGL